MSDPYYHQHKPAGKPKKMMDEGDVLTRKVTPSGAGISFAPMTSSSFKVPQFTSVSSPYDFSATQVTQSPKVDAQSAVCPGLPVTSSKAFRWQLDLVPTLPEFHPLERTAVFVPDVTPSQISERISSVLRKRSIEATYDDEKAKVRCWTASGVDFRIRLYRGRGNYSNGIIVEVQRRFGYAIDFANDTKAILDAAQDLPTVVAPPPPLAPASGANLPLVSDAEDDDEYAAPPLPTGASSLKMINKMLGHTGSHYLALQTLTSLTDPAKMGSRTAKNVSTELLKVDNEVGSKLVDLIVTEKKPEDGFNLHSMALTVLANALAAVGGLLPHMTREKIRPALLRELNEVGASNLLSAQQAARCFEFMWQGDHDVGELQAALETAKAAGEARHLGLENQAKRTLSKWTGC